MISTNASLNQKMYHCPFHVSTTPSAIKLQNYDDYLCLNCNRTFKIEEIGTKMGIALIFPPKMGITMTTKMNFDDQQRTIDQINIMKAYTEGKSIQWKAIESNIWTDCRSSPSWDWSNHEFRVKSEPKEVWINTWPHGEIIWHDPESAKKQLEVPGNENGKTVHYREVIE